MKSVVLYFGDVSRVAADVIMDECTNAHQEHVIRYGLKAEEFLHLPIVAIVRMAHDFPKQVAIRGKEGQSIGDFVGRRDLDFWGGDKMMIQTKKRCGVVPGLVQMFPQSTEFWQRLLFYGSEHGHLSHNYRDLST
jgi:hypothetical protein